MDTVPNRASVFSLMKCYAVCKKAIYSMVVTVTMTITAERIRSKSSAFWTTTRGDEEQRSSQGPLASVSAGHALKRTSLSEVQPVMKFPPMLVRASISGSSSLSSEVQPVMKFPPMLVRAFAPGKCKFFKETQSEAKLSSISCNHGNEEGDNFKVFNRLQPERKELPIFRR